MSNYEYIKMPRRFTKVITSKSNGRDINIMTMPKGVIIGETDLSNGLIYPPVMYDSDKEKDIVIGRFDKDKLVDNAINISYKKMGANKQAEVDIDILKTAIDKSVRDYYYERANTIPQENTRDEEMEW